MVAQRIAGRFVACAVMQVRQSCCPQPVVATQQQGRSELRASLRIRDRLTQRWSSYASTVALRNGERLTHPRTLTAVFLLLSVRRCVKRSRMRKRCLDRSLGELAFLRGPDLRQLRSAAEKCSQEEQPRRTTAGICRGEPPAQTNRLQGCYAERSRSAAEKNGLPLHAAGRSLVDLWQTRPVWACRPPARLPSSGRLGSAALSAPRASCAGAACR